MDPWQIVAVLAGTMTTVVGVLWREHLKADADDRRQRDEAFALLSVSLQNNRDAIAAWDKRDANDAARRRLGDGER